MTPEEFVIWLNGIYDGAESGHLTKKQSDVVRKMLSKVVFDDYIEEPSELKDIPPQHIWETSSTAHSSVERILIEYTEK